MMKLMLRFLGVTPDGSKTGKREAAWTLIAISLGLTIGAMILGHELATAIQPVLLMIWPSSILAVAGAYKLQHDKQMAQQGLEPPPVSEQPVDPAEEPPAPPPPRTFAG